MNELSLKTFRLLLEAFENAQFLCEGYYLTSPALELRSFNGMIYLSLSEETFRFFSG